MSSQMDRGEILATVEASPARRVIGVGMLVGLGLVLLYLSMISTPGLAMVTRPRLSFREVLNR